MQQPYFSFQNEIDAYVIIAKPAWEALIYYNAWLFITQLKGSEWIFPDKNLYNNM